MDIELTNDNFMEFMANDVEEEDQSLTEAALLAQMQKVRKDKADNNKEKNRFKAISEFKIKVIDFLNIYIKEVKSDMDNEKRIVIIKGLLDSLAVAHEDRSYVLFDKIKSVILTMAKQSKGSLKKTQEDSQAITILFTEIIQKIINPKIDPKVSSVYKAAFFYLVKTLKQDKEFKKFIKSTYKELLKCYLQDRASNTLKQEFFMNAFNEDLEFAYSFFKFLLKSSLPHSANEDEESKGTKTRTVYQRFLAIELLHFLIKRTYKLKQDTLFKKLSNNYELLGQCSSNILEDVFLNTKNRIKKATSILNLFIDASKTIKQSEFNATHSGVVEEN